MIAGQRKKEDVIYQQRGEFQLEGDLYNILAGVYAQNTQGQILDPSISANMDTVAMGRDTVKSSLNILYPLYTGGKISAIIEQAKLNK
jgi:hypothetical protein